MCEWLPIRLHKDILPPVVAGCRSHEHIRAVYFVIISVHFWLIQSLSGPV